MRHCFLWTGEPTSHNALSYQNVIVVLTELCIFEIGTRDISGKRSIQCDLRKNARDWGESGAGQDSRCIEIIGKSCTAAAVCKLQPDADCLGTVNGVLIG